MNDHPINRLSKEYINTLPIIRFTGKLTLVEGEKETDKIIAKLSKKKFVGFDTESKPAFLKGESNPVSIIQLATDNTAFIFQLGKTHFCNSLVSFFENQKVKKIGVGIKNDLEKLQQLRKFQAGGFIDLSKIASEKGIIQVGIRGLTARYLDHRLSKTARRTNWARPDLTEKQKIYAATDAWICLKIYPRLLADPLRYPEDEENNNSS